MCLHSGVFTRAQFCHYFDARRNRALRFVQTLVERRQAIETEWPLLNGGGKTCRISSNAIYRALGVENIPPPAQGQQAGCHATALVA